MSTQLTLVKKTLASLKPGELNTFKRYLTGFKSADKVNKSEQLLELLLVHGPVDENAISSTLGLAADSKAFIKLCSRFRAKLHDSLLFEINLEREGAYSTYSKNDVFARKNLILAELLFTRGNWEEAFKVLKKIIDICREYEFYDSLTNAYLLKYKVDLRYKSIKVAEATEVDYLNAESHRALANRSSILFHKAGFLHQKKSSPELYTEDLQKYIDELKDNPLLQDNSLALFYFYNLKLHLANSKDDFDHMLKWGKELIELLDAKVGLRNNPRYANAYAYSMIASIKLRDFEKALYYVGLSKKLINPGTLNYLNLSEYEFFIYFYSGQYQNAESLTLSMQKQAADKKLEYFHNKYQYMYACTLMKEKKYEDANRVMLNIDELDNDKEGWNIGIRLFYIMNRLEKKLYDSADVQIENFRKYFENTMKHKALRKRDLTILRILLKLEQYSYDYEEVYQRYSKLFDLLRVKNMDYKWLMLSHELIPFHEWFAEMVEKQKKKELAL